MTIPPKTFTDVTKPWPTVIIEDSAASNIKKRITIGDVTIRVPRVTDPICAICRKVVSKDERCWFQVQLSDRPEDRFTHIDCARAMRSVCMLEGAKIMRVQLDWSS